ncbi:hypothetical protein L7F22_025310 [Adiantum nelumboides]|nr:hypothetical protein [Adiantum nelumboides]
MQTTLGVSYPSSSLCKSSFLGSTSRLSRKAFVASHSLARVFKVEAKKGEWLPGLASPGYLDKSLLGDNGFASLGLAKHPTILKWYVQAKMQNVRWAMLGVGSMLILDLLTNIGIINVPKWYDAIKVEYFAAASTLFVIEFIRFHYVEVRRWQDIKYLGSVNADPFNPTLTLPSSEIGYRGGIFNPLNFPTSLEYKEKETANSRLTMLSFLGFVI